MTAEPPLGSADRRRTPRFNISLPIALTVPGSGQRYQAVVDNFSLGGVLLLTDAPLARGTKIVVHLPIGETGTADIEAAIVRTSSVGEFGVTFISLTEEEMDRLTDFVERRSENLHPLP
ncbi:MAG: PilZ domain-containing protein [Candidatus Eremiobacteraeota bacterium]|nr:PilZ domain-containing protein [Candidatus Eremiobacteraeota bacterium]MBC5828091.1 PilZ domain-containing protein [Candidatus Eremiobacteraeota bacterium]